MTKTALQQLVEWLESSTDFPGLKDAVSTKKHDFLELEKQQIINAYTYGWRLAMALSEHRPEDPEGYYINTYLQEKGITNNIEAEGLNLFENIKFNCD